MIRLLINLFKSNRHYQYLYCLQQNLKIVDQILIVLEDKIKLPQSGKIIIKHINHRPTFKELFQIANNITASNDINIISNADIYFDETIKLTNKITKNTCFTLTRHDFKNDKFILPQVPAGTQDTWVFRGQINIPPQSNFMMGYYGCDHRIAYELNAVGYNVINPCLSIKTYHIHVGRKQEPPTIKGQYKFVPPCSL